MARKSGNSSKPRKRIAAIVGAVLACVLVAGIGTAAVASGGTSLNNSNYPAGTEVTVDPATVMSYQTYPTADGYDTTANAGQLWTDKTVYAPTEGNTQEIPLSNGTTRQVDKTESGTFLTSISVLSSSLVTELIEPQPIDIVLVLDVSGSMKEGQSTIYYRPYTPAEMDALVPGNLPRNVTFFKNKTGVDGGYTNKQAWEGYIQVSKNADGSDAITVPYIDKGGDYYLLIRSDSCVTDQSQIGTYERWYYKIGNGNWSATDYNFMYTIFYQRTARYKIDDLHDAASDFVNAIAKSNTNLAKEGYGEASMNRISLVKFSGQCVGKNNFLEPNYLIGNVKGKTQIMTPLTTYQSGGTADVTQMIYGLEADGGTAADLGFTLAKGVLDGQAIDPATQQTVPGARANAKKAIVFFTDGNPKHDKGKNPNDFSGYVAQRVWDVTRGLKENQDVLVYSVAIVDGADASDTTKNLNIYLNGVSSNYPHATATNGQDNPVSGLVVPASNTWTPALGERSHDYAATGDTAPVAGKTYYTRTGAGTEDDPYVYTPVTNPVAADMGNYFESAEYYLVVGGDVSLTEAFLKIAAQLTASGGEDSTATGRDGNTAVTITDYLGDYMEFKGFNGVIYGTEQSNVELYAPGTQTAQHVQAQVQRDDTSATDSTYTMWYEPVNSALLNPPAGKETVNLNLITVQVSRSTDPSVGDTVTIKIPPELVPSTRYKATESYAADGSSVYTTTRTEADPIRVLYSVGPKATTESGVISQLEAQALRSEGATNESDRQTEAYQSFIADAAQFGADGIYKLYADTPNTGGKNAEATDAESGTTRVDMTLSTVNPYYFHVHEKLYVQEGSGAAASHRVATPDDVAALPTTLYYRHRVYRVGNKLPAESDTWMPYTVASADDYEYTVDVNGTEYTMADGSIVSSTDYTLSGGRVVVDGVEYVAVGGVVTIDGVDYPVVDNRITVTRSYPVVDGTVTIDGVTYPVTSGYITIATGKLRDVPAVTIPKTDNATETASAVNASVFDPGELLYDKHVAHQFLGNNGRIDIPIAGTLAVAKRFTAGAGLTLPADPTATMTVRFYAPGDGGPELAGSFPALLRDAEGHPLDHETHDPITGPGASDNARFTLSSGGTFTLRDGEVLKVTGLPDGATYTVTEAGMPGYAATVEDNDGTVTTYERGADASNR